ncbi:MAG: N-6 DNA methylase [Ginsengibacter sp.]
MLLQNLQRDIDEKWDECWPISSLRPLAILDLMSYIYFIKKLDDRELINKRLQGIQDEGFVYTKEVDEFSWSRLQNMDVQSIHDLFTGEHGMINLMTHYSRSNSLYSDFFKAPLILTPTPKLLLKVIELINVIESSDSAIQSGIGDYLFDKAGITGQDGQVFIPENIAWLMVAIAEPGIDDMTCDPSAGNGSLVINAARYISNRNNESSKNESFGSRGMLKSMESDLLLLRLAAMNIMLHGIKDPGLEILDILPEGSTKLPEQTALIISNLFSVEGASNIQVEGDTLKSGRSGKEIVLLNLILDNMHPGGRAVVIVPEYVLNNIAPEIKKIRQDIINNYNLEGVIYLPQKNSSLFSRAGILIFNKHETVTTSNVWFWKMKASNERLENDKTLRSKVQNGLLSSSELFEVNDILNQWKNRAEIQPGDLENCFCITAYDIKDNDYKLNFSDYKIIQKNREINKTPGIADDKKNPVVSIKKEHLHHFFEDSVPLQKKKRRSKVLRAVIPILIIISGAASFYFFYPTNFNFMNDPKKIVDSVSNTSLRDTSKRSISEPGNENKPATGRKDITKATIKNNKLNISQDPPVFSTAYTVISKAYFYSAPDTAKRRSLFLDARKDLVLTSTNEQNGFEYVVYVNKKGQTTKGWLNKKDLQPVE